VVFLALFTDLTQLQGTADHSGQPSDEYKNAWSYAVYLYFYTALHLHTKKTLFLCELQGGFFTEGLIRSPYFWKVFSSLAPCRFPTRSSAVIRKFFEVREVLLESGLRNRQE
jgi:hypothetical protein